ncbi:MAG TPA: flagellin [Methanoregula sp.]|nr:flagellin [Methanoregula sp.]
MDRPLISEYGFTGLEAAIVLIAFVVVAAVFSYVVLGAGFFTTQTAQATVHTGVQQASSSIEIVGNTYGIADPGDLTHLKYINITVALTAGGTAVDLQQMVLSYNDNNGGHNANLTYGGVAPDTNGACSNAMNGGSGTAQEWCIAEKINNQTAGAMLEQNAQMIIAVGLPDTATPSTKFTINFHPATGAVLSISRTIAGSIYPVQSLY